MKDGKTAGCSRSLLRGNGGSENLFLRLTIKKTEQVTRWVGEGRSTLGGNSESWGRGWSHCVCEGVLLLRGFWSRGTSSNMGLAREKGRSGVEKKKKGEC